MPLTRKPAAPPQVPGHDPRYLRVGRVTRRGTVRMTADALRGWVPTAVRGTGAGRRIDWMDLGDAECSQPFFVQTVLELRRREDYEVRLTGMEALEALRQSHPGPPPSGFVFHVSHCGSTAVHQMLRELSSTVSISEPRPLADVLGDATASEADRIRWLRGMVNAYGLRRDRRAARYFLKMKSWSLFDLPLVRRAFPETPWVCLVRHPLEVLVGQLRRRPLNTYWFHPPFPAACEHGEARLDIGLAEAAAMALGRYYDIAHRAVSGDPYGLCLDHRDLPGVALSSLLDHFGTSPTREELARMRQASRLYSKDGGRTVRYQDDRAAKREGAPAVVRAAVERWAETPYRRLEGLTARGERSEAASGTPRSS